MVARVLLFKSMISYIFHVLLHDRKSYGIDSTFVLSSTFQAIVVDPLFWSSSDPVHAMFDHIFKFIGSSEVNDATMATAYACLLSIKMHTYDLNHTLNDDTAILDEKLLRQSINF